jgi:hypothetical protein
MRAKTINEYQEFTRGGDPKQTMNLGKAGLKPFLIKKVLGSGLPRNTCKSLVTGFGTEEIYYFGDNDIFVEHFPGFYDYLEELTSGKPFYEGKAKYRYHDGRERVEQEDIIEIFDTEIGKIAKVYDQELPGGGAILYAGDFKAAINTNLRDKRKLLDWE